MFRLQHQSVQDTPFLSLHLLIVATITVVLEILNLCKYFRREYLIFSVASHLFSIKGVLSDDFGMFLLLIFKLVKYLILHERRLVF
jgi:hypothetical protein